MIITLFQVNDKEKKSRFFEITFLLAGISMGIAFEIFFLTLSNIEVNLNNQELKQRLYIADKAIPTSKFIDLIGKKEFVIAAFDLKDEIQVVHIESLAILNEIYFFCQTQIALLKINVVLQPFSRNILTLQMFFS